jgi:hypothetical protein
MIPSPNNDRPQPQLALLAESESPKLEFQKESIEGLPAQSVLVGPPVQVKLTIDPEKLAKALKPR